ncbi:MAG: hypothetical protein LBI54_08375, partial [Lachnospiraceae bacterium]|nr:hypothetical protein [Lachnospiraceae bacterium]
RQIRESKDETMIGVSISIMTEGYMENIASDYERYNCASFLEKPFLRENLENLLIETIPKRLLVESTDIM